MKKQRYVLLHIIQHGRDNPLKKNSMIYNSTGSAWFINRLIPPNTNLFNYYGNSDAYFAIVSPSLTKISPVPALIPDLICLLTKGGPLGNSASTEHIKRHVLFPVLMTTNWVQALKVVP